MKDEGITFLHVCLPRIDKTNPGGRAIVWSAGTWLFPSWRILPNGQNRGFLRSPPPGPPCSKRGQTGPAGRPRASQGHVAHCPVWHNAAGLCWEGAPARRKPIMDYIAGRHTHRFPGHISTWEGTPARPWTSTCTSHCPFLKAGIPRLGPRAAAMASKIVVLPLVFGPASRLKSRTRSGHR
jgi:hypothetical protein